MSTAVEATLPLADVIDDLRAEIETASGRAIADRRGDLRWAQIDRARTLKTDPLARAAAEEMAAAGHEEAIAALAHAHELVPVPQPTAGWHNNRANFGGALAFSGGVPPGLVGVLAAHRRDGLPFGTAWVMALGELRADRGPVRGVLESTRSAWRSAYYRTNAPTGYSVAPWSG